MRDEILLRLLEDACQRLKGVRFPVETPHLAPVYNALLAAAQANHPGHVYLSVLASLPADAQTGPDELNILFGQLRILMEALIEEGGADLDTAATVPGSREFPTAPTLRQPATLGPSIAATPFATSTPSGEAR